MNFGEAGIHRMFQLTQHSPREAWDVLSGLVSDVSCKVMLSGQGNPRTGGKLRPELVSPRASRPERGIFSRNP